MGEQQELFTEAPKTWSLYQHAKIVGPPEPPPDASERERRLTAALAKAKAQLHELRARLVRADCVARAWVTTPRHPAMGDAREAEVHCGSVIVRVLSSENDQSLKAALDEWRIASGG